jgi:N-acetylglucosamine-6-phosphate deacetylase
MELAPVQPYTEEDFEQILKELKDLLELYTIAPEHLKETVAINIIVTRNEVEDQTGPYSPTHTDENIKQAEKLLEAVGNILPGE